MTPQEMWNAYKKINPSIGDEIDAWAFGVEADLFGRFGFKRRKTATAQPMIFIQLITNPSTRRDLWYHLDSQDRAVCIVEITKVSVQPFHQVSADHAFKEGEGDKSLAYWRQVHGGLFRRVAERSRTDFYTWKQGCFRRISRSTHCRLLDGRKFLKSPSNPFFLKQNMI